MIVFTAPIDTRNSKGVTSALPTIGGWELDVGRDWDMGTSVAFGETQRERCFTPVFCVAVSLRANQPVHTEA